MTRAPHIIVLNLERSTDRKKLIEEQFAKLNLLETFDYSFFPCFDGKNIINMSLSVPILKGAGIGRKLRNAEISIILSHLSALKYAQVMEYKNVVIIEDDIVLCEDWSKRLDTLMKLLPEDWEYVYLSGHSDYVKFDVIEQPIVLKAPQMIGAFCYLVNKKGIEKLIKYCGELVTTYDDMIMHKISAGKLNGYVYFPFMCYHSDNMSTLWEEMSLNHDSKKFFKNKI